jgi:hypothetical protein
MTTDQTLRSTTTRSTSQDDTRLDRSLPTSACLELFDFAGGVFCPIVCLVSTPPRSSATPVFATELNIPSLRT